MLSADIRTLLRGAAAAVLTACVCACGGGGGGGSPNPVLGKLTFSTNENVALSSALSATDPGSGQVSFTQQSNPTSGALSGFTSAGAFTYTPNPNFTGNDSFTVQATDSAGHMTSGTVTITVTVNTAPTAGNTIQRIDGAALANINVLQAASDPDKDPLTLTILQQPPSGAGQVAVNSDGTVKLSGLQSGFKGVTRFVYQVKDPSGATAKATAAIFVGTDPFRVAFVGDAPANGSNEVYLTDFAADPVAMTAATQGNVRLKGFSISDNGATIAYRVQDTSSSTTSLAFVQTASPTQSTNIPLPSGTAPVADGGGKDQFIVSPDGQWIAAIAGQGSLSSLYVVNISQPTTVSQIQPSGVTAVTLPVFTLDSKSIYFLADTGSPGVHRSLYFASLATPGLTTLMSDVSDDTSTSDDISAFAVSPDQSRIAVDAIRAGKQGVYFIDTRHPGAAMSPLNNVALGRSVVASTVGLPAGRGGSTTVARVAYVEQGLAPGIYVADVSTTPHPRLQIPTPLGGSLQILGLRPDDTALLYSGQALVSEVVIDVAGTQAVGSGNNGWYDSTGNIVLLQQQALPHALLVSTSRGSFGTTDPVGTTSLAVAYNDVSGFDRGVAIIGQGPTSGSPPATATLQLVNALAPLGLFPLAAFQSPLQLTSYSSKIVSK